MLQARLIQPWKEETRLRQLIKTPGVRSDYQVNFPRDAQTIALLLSKSRMKNICISTEAVTWKRDQFPQCGESISAVCINLPKTHSQMSNGNRLRPAERDQDVFLITRHSQWKKRFSSMEDWREKIATLKFSSSNPQLLPGRQSTYLMLQAVFNQEMIMLFATVTMVVSLCLEDSLRDQEPRKSSSSCQATSLSTGKFWMMAIRTTVLLLVPHTQHLSTKTRCIFSEAKMMTTTSLMTFGNLILHHVTGESLEETQESTAQSQEADTPQLSMEPRCSSLEASMNWQRSSMTWSSLISVKWNSCRVKSLQNSSMLHQTKSRIKCSKMTSLRPHQQEPTVRMEAQDAERQWTEASLSTVELPQWDLQTRQGRLDLHQEKSAVMSRNKMDLEPQLPFQCKIDSLSRTPIQASTSTTSRWRRGSNTDSVSLASMVTPKEDSLSSESFQDLSQLLVTATQLLSTLRATCMCSEATDITCHSMISTWSSCAEHE